MLRTIGITILMVAASITGCEPTAKEDAKGTKAIDLVEYLGLDEATHILNAGREQNDRFYWMHSLSAQEKEIFRRRLRKPRTFMAKHLKELVNHERDAYLRFYSKGKPVGPWFFQRWVVPYPPKFKDVGIGILTQTNSGLQVMVSQEHTQQVPYGTGTTKYSPAKGELLPSSVRYGPKETELPFPF